MLNLLKLGSMSLHMIECEWVGGEIWVQSSCLLFLRLKALSSL